MPKFLSWLARLLQTLKVFVFRRYYRISNALAWRGHIGEGPYTELSIPVSDATIGARLYSNARGKAKPLIVFFHGGGWVIGDLQTHHPFCSALSESTGCSVISVNYRLAPEHRFPTAQDDCLAAVQWAAVHSDELGCNNGLLVVAGDSAGGNLSACVCQELDPDSRTKVAGQLLINPATDHYSTNYVSHVEKATGQALTTSIVQWFWNTYLGDQSPHSANTQRAFPIRSAQLTESPPTLLVTAENDPLRDEGKAFAIKLEQAGVPVDFQHFPNAAHGFACSEGPHADFRSFINQVNNWLTRFGQND